jgi:undecaprenyl-diphosphatase
MFTAASYLHYDQSVAAFFHDYFKGTYFRSIFAQMSELGEAQWYLVPGLAAYAWFRKTRPDWSRKGLALFTSVASAGIGINLLRPTLARCRPGLLFKESSYGFEFMELDHMYHSFPSGHAAVAIAGGVMLAMLLPGLRWFFISLGVLLAAGRVVTNDHFPADVVAGSWVGLTCALLTWHYLVRPPGHSPQTLLHE